MSATTATEASARTLDDWILNNRNRFRCGELQREIADHLLSKSQRICDSSRDIVEANKGETEFLLKERIEDLEQRRHELIRVRQDISQELDSLQEYKERIEITLKSVKRNALGISLQCLEFRRKRIGVDLVNDEVEQELLVECDLIKSSEVILTALRDETREQIRRLKATIYDIDNDLSEKERSLDIDKNNLSLKTQSKELCIYRGRARLDLSTNTFNEWDSRTDSLIVESTKECNVGKQMHSYVDNTLRNTIKKLTDQKDKTDNTFLKYIQRTKEIKAKLESQNTELVKQINNMNDNITRLKTEIADKEPYMALAHTRLLNRCHRPGLELVQDRVEFGLIKEVVELEETISNLQQTLLQAEASMRYLLRNKVLTEEEINIKANTLKIDEVDCMAIRQNITYHAF